MKILIIEDEHKIANAIRKGLEQERYTVDVRYDGKDGFDLASSEDYDLIILDRLLPGMEGVVIVKELRKARIHTPILMLTAKGQISDKVEGLDAGADDYLTKPFAFGELIARVRALARRPKSTQASRLHVGDLFVDTQTYEVTRGGTDIHLSSKEFALLAYLIRYPDKIITKDQIINHVWNYDADVLPNSVEVYIKHLRDKVDAPFPTGRLIHTVRGFGYKIGVEK